MGEFKYPMGLEIKGKITSFEFNTKNFRVVIEKYFIRANSRDC